MKGTYIKIEQIMDIDSRLAAIEETQNEILRLLAKRAPPEPSVMTLKQAAEYVGFFHAAELGALSRKQDYRQEFPILF